jgi:hypothetical protein
LQLRFGFVLRTEQALVIQGGDLPIQRPHAPALINGFFGVPIAGLRVVDADQAAIVGPTQFKTQCVTNWEMLKEQAHIAQVADIKPRAKFLAQALGQFRQYLLAVGRALLPALLVFHYHTANLPIGLHHGGVDGLPHLGAGSQ